MKEIAHRVGVSLSSVSHWVRDIQLTEDQCARLQSRNPAINGQVVAASNRRRALERRIAFQRSGRCQAQSKEVLHVAGCMLYWAEGAKSKNAVHFSNSDPAMVRYFVAFLREYFGVPDEAFRIWCNLFADHLDKQHEIEYFWLDLLQLPSACLCKSTVNVYSKHSQKKRRNRLPYGTVRVSVHSTEIVQQI